MTFDPRTKIDIQEHGNSFDLIDEKSKWLIDQSKKSGISAQVRTRWIIEGTTRYANSQVTQHTDLNTISIDLKLSKDKKFSQASSSILTDQGVQDLFNQVEKSLKNTPSIDFYQGLPESKKISLVDSKGLDWSMEDRAESIVTASNAAEELDGKVITAGTATETIEFRKVLSTEGIEVEDAVQRNYFKVNSICGEPEKRGYGQEELFWRYKVPDYAEMARTATQTAVDTINLLDLDAPKDYEVLLGPQSVSNLLVYVLFSLDATSFHESNSFASDRIGDKIFDKQFNLENLPRDPKQVTQTASFDFEGMPTENRALFEEGVLKFITYSSFSAAKYLGDKNASTSTFLELPWGSTTIPISISMEGGAKSLNDQISDVDDGLYVKNFWYNRFTLRREGGLTGLTRNGLYHIKNGEIQGAVRNLRYTESFLRAFGEGNILSLSKERRQFGMATVPSLHLRDFHFSSVAHTKD